MEAAASLLVNSMGRRKFKDYFLGTFDKEIDTYTKNQQLLPKLFRETIITTNYDHLLESLYESQENIKLDVLLPRDEKDHAAIDRMIQQGNPYLIKLHGDVSRYEYCIITEEQYQEIYTGSSEYEKMLSRIFENKIMLFLGCSLDLDRTLVFLRELNHNRDIVHYAIVPLPEITKNPDNPFLPLLYEADSTRTLKRELLERDRQLADYDIRPIYYPFEKYESIAAILEELYQLFFFKERDRFEKEFTADGINVISTKTIQKKQSLTEGQKLYSLIQFYKVSSNWDCMFSVICNDFDVLDMELIDLAVQTLKEGNSLIIAGNGGQGKTSQ